MPTPTPFEPLWQAACGPLLASGQGLLNGEASRNRDLLDSFSVRVPGGKVTVKPRTGEMFLGSAQVAKAGESRLVWFRKMQIELGTHDKNSAAAQCLWYGIGIESNRGRFGFHILPDGRLVEGLPL